MEKEPAVSRVNFNLPRKTYDRMMDLANNVLGIESAGGAAKYFCMLGFHHGMASLIAAKNAEHSIENVQANKQMVALMATMMNDVEKYAGIDSETAASSILDTMGISRNHETQQNSGSAKVRRKKAGRMK